MDDLRQRLDEARQLRAQADEQEADVVRDALRASDGRVYAAARLLGLPPSTLFRLVQHGRLKHLIDETAGIPGRPTLQKVT